MGWFSNRGGGRGKGGSAELDELRAEIRQLREQVDQADQTNATLAMQLAERIAETDELHERSGEQLAAFDTRRTQLEQQLTDVNAAQTQLESELDELRADLADQQAADRSTERHRADVVPFPAPTAPPFAATDLANRLEDLQAAVAGHHAQLAGLTDANRMLSELRHRLGDVDDLKTRLDDTVHDTDDLRAQVVDLGRRYQIVDERITHTSTELAAQLTELSNELDALPSAPTSASTGDDVASHAAAEADDGRIAATLDEVAVALDALKTAQERLANEQARYQIQFRKDLAALADRSARHTG